MWTIKDKGFCQIIIRHAHYLILNLENLKSLGFAFHTDMQMTDGIPRWRDPCCKGSLSGIQSGRRWHHKRGCRGGLIERAWWAQGEELGAKRCRRNWGVGRNSGPSWAWRRSRETKPSVTWTDWGRSSPGSGDRVGPIALGDGHGGRRRVQRKGMPQRDRGRWAGGNNKLWSRRCRRNSGCSWSG